MSNIFKDFAPAILAGLIGGLGAFTAVKVDIAVLKENQNNFREDLAVVKTLSESMIEVKGTEKFLQFQLDTIRRDLEREGFTKK